MSKINFFVLLVSLSFFPIFAFAQETVIRDATYYSDSFNGGRTANGEVFYQTGYSAAVCDINIPQLLYVQSAHTGIVIRANDRPNCTKNPNIIDLSRESFKDFSSLNTGRITNLLVTPLGGDIKDSFLKGFFDVNVFSHLGIILDSQIPNVYFSGEGIEVSGRVTNGKKEVLLYLEKEGSGSVSTDILTSVGVDGTFRARLVLPNVSGKYTFIVAGGNSFNTDKYSSIMLLDRSTLSYPEMPSIKQKIIPKIENVNAKISISLPDKFWADIILTQEGKIFKSSGTKPSLQNTGLHIGKAQLTMKGYLLSTNSSLDRASFLPSMFSGVVILDRIHEKVGEDKVSVRMNTRGVILKMKIPINTKIRDKYYVTSPSGEVREFSFASKYIADDGYLNVGMDISLSIPFKMDGTYLVELVQSNGLAYVNLPLTRGQVWNILSTISGDEIRTIRTKFSIIEKYVLNRVNIIRASLSRDFLVSDPELTRLAQAKVDDMIAGGYVGHITPGGLDIVGFARAKKFNLVGAIGENIAYGNVSDISLQDGLEESGSHRLNIIRKEWKKIGIGYAVNKGNAYLVQVFGE